MFDSSKESAELYCVHAREKLTNSIRLQWRRLKSHVEKLNSQGDDCCRHFGSMNRCLRKGVILDIADFLCCLFVALPQMGDSTNSDVPRETHEEEMDRLKMEIQQFKDFIQTQQQLLQVKLNNCKEYLQVFPMFPLMLT